MSIENMFGDLDKIDILAETKMPIYNASATVKKKSDSKRKSQ